MNLFKTGFFVVLANLIFSCSGQENQEFTNEEQVTLKEQETLVDEIVAGRKFTLSTPVNYKNLQIFMIEGECNADNVEYVPLKKAMEKKWVEIKETSEVNELEITNLSDKVIFINAGDIVRGGKQDRTLTYDMIIGPHSKNEKLASFCVESGRWKKRGQENVDKFESNKNMLSSRKLKIASKKDNNQQKVWKSVADQQEKLSHNVSHYSNKEVNVKSGESSSSLELTLGNDDLIKMRKTYKQQFENLIRERTLGFAYAINGELYAIELYNNKQLFADLFDKLLEAAIVEAIAELDVDKKEYESIEEKTVYSAINNKDYEEESRKDLNTRTRWQTKENNLKVSFTSLDIQNKGVWLHENILVKDKNEEEPVSKIRSSNFNDNNQVQIEN